MVTERYERGKQEGIGNRQRQGIDTGKGDRTRKVEDIFPLVKGK